MKVRGYTSLYYAARLLNLEWLQQGAVNRMFPSSDGYVEKSGAAMVTSYAVLRADGEWSVMLVNRDHENARTVRVNFDTVGSKAPGAFHGKVTMTTFGSEQYVWHDDGANSHADPDVPPTSRRVSANARTVFTLPKASVAILRGKVKGLPRGR